MKSLPTFTDLFIADITVPSDRLRPISEAKVAALMQVIEEGLFLGAVTVRRSGKTNSLIDDELQRRTDGTFKKPQKRAVGNLGLQAGYEAGQGESIHRPVSEGKTLRIGN